jgi:polar amino acid transport system ATP-binding protein
VSIAPFAIEVTDICKSFGSMQVVKGVSLKVPRGAVVALIGPSGAGKSTLLRCINLLEQPDSGSIRVGDRTMSFTAGQRGFPADRVLAAFRAETGMVFQHFNLFPHMTALQNVMEGPVTVKGTAKREAAELARDLLARVGLSDKTDAYPLRLSGGQRQRVAIARALAMRPQAMLFDEVTSALDPQLVGEVLEVIQQLATDGMTMIIVTHEIAFAHEVADTIGFMADGMLVEYGTPVEVLERPTDPRTKAFLDRYHRFLGAYPHARSRGGKNA